MPLHRSVPLIEKAKEEKRRERYYQLWLVRYPRYSEKNFQTFDEFYESIFPAPIVYDTRSKDDIMKEIIGG